MELTNQIAIVTGASSGLGAAISKALVGEGATVYALGRKRDALEKIRADVGEKFLPVVLDITDGKAVNRWFSQTFSQEHSPAILVNNAGAGSFGKIDEMPQSEWYAMVNTNLNGLYLITSEAIKLMKGRRESSHILNIGSILGTTTRAEGAAYCATKFGISGFSEALFKEVRGDNIKVTCLNPGSIETDFFKSSGIEAHGNMLQPDALAQTVVHVLKTPENMLISELTVRPLNPKAPE